MLYIKYNNFLQLNLKEKEQKLKFDLWLGGKII